MGGGQQSGFASTSFWSEFGHAVVWRGSTIRPWTCTRQISADSASRLHLALTAHDKWEWLEATYRFMAAATRTPILWSSTPDSAIDLHPIKLPEFDTSKAVAISGMQQVGSGSGSGTGGKEHALLWFGSAVSAVDLNPTLLTYIESSTVRGTNGTFQVGWGHIRSAIRTLHYCGTVHRTRRLTWGHYCPPILQALMPTASTRMAPCGALQLMPISRSMPLSGLSCRNRRALLKQ